MRVSFVSLNYDLYSAPITPISMILDYVIMTPSCMAFIELNTLKPRQNGCHFADDIFKCIFLNENVWIPIKISLKFVPKGPINNIPSLVQIMVWRRSGAKPLSEPMMVSLLTHICVTRPQWVNKTACIFYFAVIMISVLGCFVLYFIHVLLCCIIGTGAIQWLSQCLWGYTASYAGVKFSWSKPW